MKTALGAAVTSESAWWIGGWADGLLTVGGAPETIRQTIDAFHKGSGGGKPVHLQVTLSYYHDEAAARQGAHDLWRTNIFPSGVSAELWSLSQFESVARYVRPEDMDSVVRIAADPRRHIE